MINLLYFDIMELFYLNWILIDTIIIILLLIFLISVRIFKSSQRWRSSFSNTDLEEYKLDLSSISYKLVNIEINKCIFIQNHALKEISLDNPTIIFLKTGRKRKLIHILAESLATYGLNVMIIDCCISPCDECSILEDEVKKEVRYMVSLMINSLLEKGHNLSKTHIAINYSNANFPFEPFISNDQSEFLILINPSLSDGTIENFQDAAIPSKQDLKLFTIFSANARLFMKNSDIQMFQKHIESKFKGFSYRIIDKAPKSFKYYETLLLGTIFELIQTNLPSK